MKELRKMTESKWVSWGCFTHPTYRSFSTIFKPQKCPKLTFEDIKFWEWMMLAHAFMKRSAISWLNGFSERTNCSSKGCWSSTMPGEGTGTSNINACFNWIMIPLLYLQNVWWFRFPAPGMVLKSLLNELETHTQTSTGEFTGFLPSYCDSMLTAQPNPPNSQAKPPCGNVNPKGCAQKVPQWFLLCGSKWVHANLRAPPPNAT